MLFILCRTNTREDNIKMVQDQQLAEHYEEYQGDWYPEFDVADNYAIDDFDTGLFNAIW